MSKKRLFTFTVDYKDPRQRIVGVKGKVYIAQAGYLKSAWWWTGENGGKYLWAGEIEAIAKILTKDNTTEEEREMYSMLYPDVVFT